MSIKDFQDLIEENIKLKNEIKEKNTEIKQKDIEIENLKLHINQLNRYIFGSKKESTPKEENIVEGTQCSIFGEIQNKEIKEQVEEKTEEIIAYKKKNAKKKKSGIKKSELKNVEQETIIFKLEGEQLKCPECGAELKKIGTEVVRQEVEYIPAKLKLKTYVREVYKCEECGKEDSNKETQTIIKPKMPKPILTHSFVSSSLATEVIYQKYYMGVPLYRQEKSWDDKGLVLPRSMTSNWCIKLSEYYLEPIYNLMLKKIKENSQLLHSDESAPRAYRQVV